MMSGSTGLGNHVVTYGPAGGWAGFQNRGPVRTALLTLAGLMVGFVPGLFVALITDFLPALLITALLGAAGAYWWASRLNFEAAVTEARLHEGGVVFIDARGSHTLLWEQIASFEGKHVKHVAGTGVLGFGDIEGATLHSYLIRARDGTGYWLDDRIDKVGALAEAIARASRVNVRPMA